MSFSLSHVTHRLGKWGRLEGPRTPTPTQIPARVLSRQEKMVHGLDLARMAGAEIGPLDKPVVAKTAGQVIYIDHVDADALRAKYAGDPMVDAGKLHVDAIWGAMTLREAIAHYALTEEGAFAANGCDYVIASHVIEHVPDMVSWLQEVHAVLKPDGQLRLAIPDRRFTFDYLRQPTGLAAVVNAYARKDRVPNTHSILDFMLNMAPVDCAAAWRGEVDASKLQRRATFEGAMAVVTDAIQNGTYHDVHCWVFTPASFGQLCVDLAQNGLLEFECAEFFDTAVNEYEFIVSMRKCTDTQRNVESWRRMIASCRAQDVRDLEPEV
jgi:SAM-dependent methyltransferase